MERTTAASALPRGVPGTPADLIASINPELTYLLPDRFEGDIFSSFVAGTKTADSTVNELLSSARDKPFISFDDDFLSLLGSSPKIELIDEREENFAGEAGVWIRDRNEVWYTTWIVDGPTHV